MQFDKPGEYKPSFLENSIENALDVLCGTNRSGKPFFPPFLEAWNCPGFYGVLHRLLL